MLASGGRVNKMSKKVLDAGRMRRLSCNKRDTQGDLTVTEYTIGQPVRFKTFYRGYGNAARSIGDELPDWLADAVLAGEPIQVTVNGYDYDQEEDTDVVIVNVQCSGRQPFEQWVHPEAITPV